MTSIGLLILMIWMLAKSLLQQCLPRNQRLHRYGFVVSENIRKLFGFDGFVKDKKTELRINVTEKPKKLVAKVNKKTVKLMEVTTAEDFLKGENVYWYEATPNLNKFATKGSESVFATHPEKRNRQFQNQKDYGHDAHLFCICCLACAISSYQNGVRVLFLFISD